MGKYSDMDRIPRDLYPTPKKAVQYLVRHLIMNDSLHDLKRYIEPCANNGSLVKHIQDVSETMGVPFVPECVYMSDVAPDQISPELGTIYEHEAGGSPTRGYYDWSDSLTDRQVTFITNPPWINTSSSEYMLNNIILNLAQHAPTWLLLNSTYAWNQKSRPYMNICTDVVPVGRLKWIEDSDSVGKEDCAWFRFSGNVEVHSDVKEYPNEPTRLWPRIKL